MRGVGRIIFSLALLVGAPVAAQAQSGELQTLVQRSREDVLKTLNFRAGTAVVGDDLARINLPSNFRFLDNSDAQTFLTKIWGNAPGVGRASLGLITPSDVDLLSRESWAIVVSYEPIGHVRDDDAATLDQAALLKDLQATILQISRERIAAGFDPFAMPGWAREPSYDPERKTLSWAKRLRFGEGSETLNYDVRALGRRGVLSLNVVASMEAFPAIDARLGEIVRMIAFNPEQAYAAFDPKRDKVAPHGLAGLISSGKNGNGFVEWLIASALGPSNFLVIGAFVAAAGLWAGFRKAFRKAS